LFSESLAGGTLILVVLERATRRGSYISRSAGRKVMMMSSVAVVGGGIVGLATARALQRHLSGVSVTVIEKEDHVAAHQTGRNSGVIHSGIYYAPGSRKAELVATGRRLLDDFLVEHGITHERCGKVVVAVDAEEVSRLEALEERGRGHGLAVRRLGPGELHDLEPHSRGVAALHVPETGICDYRAMCEALAGEISAAGGSVRTGVRVNALDESSSGVLVGLDSVEDMAVDWLVNCAGLHSDRVARMAGADTEASIMPFRGEYYELRPEAAGLVRNLIYPVPDPRFPFLGVHFTRMVDGGVHAGPNAVLALAREGYDWTTVDRRDLWEVASNPGAWRLARRYWRTGAGEIHRSLSKKAFVAALQRLVPELTAKDLAPSAAGIRAQAIRRSGDLVDDFEFADGVRSVHVVNAPSPAATASLAIGDAIAERLVDRTR